MEVQRNWGPEVDALCDLLRRIYLDALVAERVAARLRERLGEGAYAPIAEERAFAVAITEDTVGVSGDRHLQLRYSVTPLPDAPVVAESGRHRGEAAAAGHGFARVERLAGNVGLVDIHRFFPLSMSRHAAIGAMHLVADTDVLLVDLRKAMGGEPDMAAFLCSYLFDERVHLTDLYFPADDRIIEWWTDPAVPEPKFGGGKPVYVLTSSATISAAEGYAYDLQQIGRAMLIGEVTAGAANFDFRYRVSDHLMFSVPSGGPVNPVSGRGWEGIGIRPDVQVDAAAAHSAAYGMALEHVIGLGGDGHRRPILDEALRAVGDR